jgi:hypothetical protein
MCVFVVYLRGIQGDSWTLAFHDAEDAVAFSLQVSLASVVGLDWDTVRHWVFLLQAWLS